MVASGQECPGPQRDVLDTIIFFIMFSQRRGQGLTFGCFYRVAFRTPGFGFFIGIGLGAQKLAIFSQHVPRALRLLCSFRSDSGVQRFERSLLDKSKAQIWMIFHSRVRGTKILDITSRRAPGPKDMDVPCYLKIWIIRPRKQRIGRYLVEGSTDFGASLQRNSRRKD